MMAIFLLLLALAGCAAPLPPRLVVVEKHQLAGKLGAYWNGTIYLAPGADERVLTHELGHHRGQGEQGAQWQEIYLWGYKP